jgi:hypothetical protein
MRRQPLTSSISFLQKSRASRAFYRAVKEFEVSHVYDHHAVYVF